MTDEAVLLAGSFAEIIARNGMDWVNQKIELARKKKELQSQQNEYEAIINNLLKDKLELERIAQQYQSMYMSINITDDDMEYLHSTLNKIMNILVGISPDAANNHESLTSVIALLDKDLLKSMQLLGFSYKDGIGKPLTQLCASKIESLGSLKKSGFSPKKQ